MKRKINFFFNEQEKFEQRKKRKFFSGEQINEQINDNEIKFNEIKFNEIKFNEIKFNEIKFNEMNDEQINEKLKEYGIKNKKLKELIGLKGEFSNLYHNMKLPMDYQNFEFERKEENFIDSHLLKGEKVYCNLNNDDDDIIKILIKFQSRKFQIVDNTTIIIEPCSFYKTLPGRGRLENSIWHKKIERLPDLFDLKPNMLGIVEMSKFLIVYTKTIDLKMPMYFKHAFYINESNIEMMFYFLFFWKPSFNNCIMFILQIDNDNEEIEINEEINEEIETIEIIENLYYFDHIPKLKKLIKLIKKTKHLRLLKKDKLILNEIELRRCKSMFGNITQVSKRKYWNLTKVYPFLLLKII